MDLTQATRMLSAMGNPIRLAVYRRLVQAGPGGMPAGQLAKAIDMPASSLNFHLNELQGAGLLSARQEGRFVIYSVTYPAMGDLIKFLTDKCCGGNPCLPVSAEPCATQSTQTPVKAKRVQSSTLACDADGKNRGQEPR
jgi:DNA-binding transcriptional ArsR family regulator